MKPTIIALQSISIIILTLIAMATSFEGLNRNEKSGNLAWIAIVGLFGTCFDMLSFIFSGHLGVDFIVWATNLLAMISAIWFGMGFCRYSIAHIREKTPIADKYLLISRVWGCLAMLFTTVGCITGHIFYIVDGAFYSGPLYYVNMIIVISLGFYSVYLTIRFHKFLDVQETITLTSYMAAPIITSLIEFLIPGLALTYVGLAIATLILYIFIQSETVRKAHLEEEAAKLLAKEKSDFIARFSHEIRTPINAVIGLDEMILRSTNDHEILQYGRDIKSSGEMLLGIINDILDSSKLEAGKVELTPAPYSTTKLIHDIYNMLIARAQAKELALRLEIDSKLPSMLYGDETKVKQIITNLLTNAVKYTKEGSVTLVVQCMESSTDTAQIHVEVRDTGIGIKAEDVDKLFAPFTRIEELRNRNIEGTGLGMFITQNFLKLMNSEVHVASEYGKGSVFSFDIEQGIHDASPIGDYEQALEKMRSVRHDYHELFTAPDAHILVVDDVPMNLRVATSLLKKTQVQCDTAASGPEAIEKCGKQKYDLILMDLLMPGMDGIETFHRIRGEIKDSATPVRSDTTLLSQTTPGAGNLLLNQTTPCIALTAVEQQDTASMFAKEGFTDYLPKPINASLLEEKLKTHLPAELLV